MSLDALRVRRLDARATAADRAPTRGTPGSTCTRSRTAGSTPASARPLRTGIAVEIPDGHAGLVLPRSGLAARQGSRSSTPPA